MNIGIIVGSIRETSESARVADVIASLVTDAEVDILNLRDLNVPLWSEEKWQAGSDLQNLWQPIRQRLQACDAFVVISPEWAGMAPAHLKNFLLMCDGGELAHKPALLVGVSSGMGGAYPIAELRSSGYKNNYIWWLPDHIILRNVKELFVGDDELSQSLKDRISYCLQWLQKTATALKPVREECQDLEKYPFGM